MIERTLPPLTGSFPDKIDIKKAEFHKLKNGIPLFVLNAGTQPVAKVELIFDKGGNGYEDRLGQSFFANKLLNSGTQDYSSAEITELFAEVGATLEISPGFDHSSISMLCLEKHLTKVLPLFISIVRDCDYPEEELRREKELQITNLRIQQTKTNIRASKAVRNALFPDGHSYGKIMSEQDIESLTSDDLKAFHKSRLGEFEVILTGSFTTSVLSFIQEQFEAVSPVASNNDNIVAKPGLAGIQKLRIPMDNSVQCSIRIAKRIAEKDHDDYIANFITNHVLGGYFGSRLMKNIREEKGLTYGIYSSIVNFQKASYFVISTDVKSDLVDQAMEEIYKELRILMTELVPEVELEKVKSHLIGSYQSELNSAFALASKFKNVHQYGLGYEYYDKYLNAIKNVTSAQILASAQQYFNPEDMTEVIAGG